MKLSLCMIVKNEEDVIERCLKTALPIADEIIVVDTGSNDKTKQIVSKYTKNVYDFEWIDDFAAARNYSFSKATGDYIMWLDADDIVTPTNADKIINLKNTYDPQTDIFMLKYNVAFDKNNNPTFTYYRERIVRNCEKLKWQSPIHEVIPLIGKIVYEDISIEHKKMKIANPKRNLEIFQKMINNSIELDARQQFYYGRELLYNNQDADATNILEDFLKRPDGWIENKIDACKLLGVLYARNGDIEQSLNTLFQSFKYAPPRSNICCDIGKIFFEKEDYKNAIYWYETATTQNPNNVTNAFVEPDTYNYIPYMQLCVIYYRLGNYAKANEYNKLAGAIKPNDANYLYNKKLFSEIG